MNAKSRSRISNPPPLGGVTPVLTVTVLPLSAVTVSQSRFVSTVGAIAAGNQALCRYRCAGLDGQVIGPVVRKRNVVTY